jgi:hypothetical protein
MLRREVGWTRQQQICVRAWISSLLSNVLRDLLTEKLTCDQRIVDICFNTISTLTAITRYVIVFLLCFFPIFIWPLWTLVAKCELYTEESFAGQGTGMTHTHTNKSRTWVYTYRCSRRDVTQTCLSVNLGLNVTSNIVQSFRASSHVHLVQNSVALIDTFSFLLGVLSLLLLYLFSLL